MVICLVACDHLRPCNSFLTYSFFSCKDRALERDRPYQREKKSGVASAWLALSLLRSPLALPSPRLVLWCLLVQSVFCWSLPLGIWLYLRRPGCHACGMVCCDGLAPVFTSPHGNKGFGPVWGFALYTMLRVLFWYPSFLH